MTSKEADATLALCEAATEGPWRARIGPNDLAGFDGPLPVEDAAYPNLVFLTVADAKFIAHARTALPNAIRMLREAAEILRGRCPICGMGEKSVELACGIFTHHHGTCYCKYAAAERQWLARWDGEPEGTKHGEG